MRVSSFMRQFDPPLFKEQYCEYLGKEEGWGMGVEKRPLQPPCFSSYDPFSSRFLLPLSDFATYTHIWLQLYVVRMIWVGCRVGVTFMRHIHLPSAPHFTLLYVLHKNWQYLKSLSSSSCSLHRRFGTSRTFSHKTATQKDFFHAFINESRDNRQAESYSLQHITRSFVLVTKRKFLGPE